MDDPLELLKETKNQVKENRASSLADLQRLRDQTAKAIELLGQEAVDVRARLDALESDDEPEP